MFSKSIRFKILSWFSVSLFIGVLISFSIFYFITRQILFSQVDRELTNHSQKFIQLLTSTTKLATIDFSDTPGMVVTLLDANGVVIQSTLGPDSPFVSYNYIFKLTKDSENPIFVNQSVSNMPMRFIATPVRSESGLVGMALVAHPIDAIQKSLSLLSKVLAFLLIILSIPIYIIGNMLAFKIASPLTQIGDQIEEITSENLEKRVSYPNSGDEIEVLGKNFNNLLDRLQESFKRERQFIGDITHELKTPIAILKSDIELALAKDRSVSSYQKVLKENLIDINNLSNLTRNILDLAWVKANKQSGKTFDLSSLMHEAEEIAAKLATQKNITFKSNITPGIIIKGFPDKLVRAIINILDNAFKYTSAGGKVNLDVFKKKKDVYIAVKDNGKGISKKELPFIFERFNRGSEVKAPGSGLGLSITEGIVKMHGGKINITSTLGKGTEVTIILMNS